MLYKHYFADNQYCIKCGKWEGLPEDNDCPASLEEYDEWIKTTEGKKQFPWKYKKEIMLITPEYQELQHKFHNQRPDYGVSGQQHCEPLQNFCQRLNTKDVLDYGCGKATLQKGLPFPIQNYDPCVDEYSKRPVPADIVVCTDVLEHIEPECLKAVLDDMRILTKRMLFVNIACRPAKKVLPDGRNAHIIQESPNWWLSWLLPRFDLQSFQAQDGQFTAILTPNEPPATDA